MAAGIPIQFKLLALLTMANSAPLILKWVGRGRTFAPLDFGLVLADGRPLFGPSKTWAGAACAIIGTALLAPVLSTTLAAGTFAGAGAMLGDLVSSFVKRRLGLRPSAPAPGLDQLPESVLPLVLIRAALPCSWGDILVVAATFTAGEMAIALVLSRLGWRERPF